MKLAKSYGVKSFRHTLTAPGRGSSLYNNGICSRRSLQLHHGGLAFNFVLSQEHIEAARAADWNLIVSPTVSG